MKTRCSWAARLVGLTALLGAGGCNAISSTAQRAGLETVGAAVGGAAGYELGDHRPGPTLVGAVAGGALTHLGLGEDPEVRQAGFDDGYVQGQSDAIKRQYFLRQALEVRPPAPDREEGASVYYVMPGPEVTTDGRKLEPHQVAIRVVE